MYEDALAIFDYLPIDAGSHSLYINHLWSAFEGLMEKGEPAQSFAILPFHLLFMFAVQYKVYRLSALNPAKYVAILGNSNLRDKTQLPALEVNPPIPDANGIISSTCSVVNLSILPEKYLFEFLKITEADDTLIERAKILVEIRGSYAHANGNIEEDLELRINEYLDVLRDIQVSMAPVNDLLADTWVGEITPDETPNEFIQARLRDSYTCRADFADGKLAVSFGTILE